MPKDSDKDFTKDTSLLQFLSEYWLILLFIGSLIVTWTQFQGRISSLEDRVAKVESEQAAQSTTLNQITNDITEIKTTVLFIKSTVAPGSPSF